MKPDWYDSGWLQIYNRARTLLKELDPDQLSVFETSLGALAPPAGFTTRVLPGFIDERLLTEVRSLVAAIPEADLERNEFFDFGRLILHDHPRFTELQTELTEEVSQLCGEAVAPSYNFLSLYNNLGVCEPHLDSPYSKWTLDICIDQSDPWPIHISDPTGFPKAEELHENWQEELLAQTRFNRFESEPGDALLFAGSHQWHYRERIQQTRQHNFCHLIFLHFTPVAHQDLIDPGNWPTQLKLPVLNELRDEFDRFHRHAGLDLTRSPG